jgi:hypothetical protein
LAYVLPPVNLHLLYNIGFSIGFIVLESHLSLSQRWTVQGGTSNGILSMDFDFASQPGKPDMLLSMDVNEDAIVIINAVGQIMLVSQV